MSLRVSLIICGFVGLVAYGSAGQEPKDSSFRGRLPAYYGEIVTEEQRQKIYAVQGKYEKSISALEDQLEAIKKKRDAEIFDVLNEEQKKKLKKKQDDVATDRKKKAADTKKAGK
jgi:hypothetical protein